MIRVVLVQAMPVLREALAGALNQYPELEVVGETGDGAEVIPLAVDTRPDVVVLDDIGLENARSVTVAADLRRRLPGVRILLLVQAAKPGLVREALTIGVDGVLRTRVSVSEVAAAIAATSEGKRTIDADLVTAALEVGENPLSYRERLVLQLTADGVSPRAIGGRLHLAEGTVRNHITRAIGKLSARNAVEAVRIADRIGWLECAGDPCTPKRGTGAADVRQMSSAV